MDKFAFLTDQEHLCDALGIKQARSKEIIKTCHVALIEGEGALSAMLEYAMNRLKPQNEVEAAYIGFCLKAAIDFQSPFTKLEMIMQQIKEQE